MKRKPFPEGWQKVSEDHLQITYCKRIDGRLTYITKGKRVAKNCALTLNERRMYIKRGIIDAVKLIRDSRCLSLREAKDLFDSIRGEVRRYTFKED